MGADTQSVDGTWLEQLAKEAGAEDVGFASVTSPLLEGERDAVSDTMPDARAFISLLVRINPNNARSKWMSVLNHEFGYANKLVDTVSADLSRRLMDHGIGAAHFPALFPTETKIVAGRAWPVSHKLVAEAAGMGRMGHSRNLLHPEFGSFVCLSTIVIDREVSEYRGPLEESPCTNCRMCVKACPTGAVAEDGRLNVVNCLVHNYRHRLGGFVDWVETVADSKSAADYRDRVDESDSLSVWQSLTYATEYTCCNCIAACPVGIGKLKKRPSALIDDLLKRSDRIYVLSGSDAEERARQLFPPSAVKVVKGGLHPGDPKSFFATLPLLFQPGQSAGIDAVYHFSLTGEDVHDATVEIRDRAVSVTDGLVGEADVHVTADANTWFGLLAGTANPVLAVLTRKMKVEGPRELLDAFSRCFAG